MGLFELESVAWTEPRLLEREADLLIVFVEAGLLVAERCGLAITQLDSLAPSIEDSGMNPAAFSCFSLTSIFGNPSQPREL